MERTIYVMIAKFPSSHDDISVVRWEAVALTLAKACGIAVPDFQVHLISQLPVLLLKRFDRHGL